MYDTFQEAYLEVLDRCRSIKTDPDYVDLAKSFTNRIHKEALAYRAWPWRSRRGTLVLEPPYTTGTVTVTQGSATVTGAGTAFTASHDGFYLKVGSTSDLYLVSDVLSGTSLTVDPVITIPSASAQSFKLFRMGYALPADFRLPDEVDNFETTPPMDFVGHREYRRLIGSPLFDPTPTKWSLLWTQVADDAPVPTMAVFPFASGYRQVHFDYQMRIGDLANAADPLQIPDEYRALVVEGAMELAYRDVFDDETRADKAGAAHRGILLRMANDYGFFDDQIQLVPHNYRGKTLTTDAASLTRTIWSRR